MTRVIMGWLTNFQVGTRPVWLRQLLHRSRLTVTATRKNDCSYRVILLPHPPSLSAEGASSGAVAMPVWLEV